MNTSQLLAKIRSNLRAQADEKTKEGARRYFKEPVLCYGVKTAAVGKIAHSHFAAIKNVPKNEVYSLCDALFASGVCEESFIACDFAYHMRKCYKPEDFFVFQSWIQKYVNNWATCDTLCNHTIGFFIEQYPEFIAELKTWTGSQNRWVKRASAVTLILPARKGKFLTDIFEIANALLVDPEDLVQKGYGWMLKEASKAHQKEVFEYVMARKKIMPRTALRYAIEKMPPELRVKAMER